MSPESVATACIIAGVFLLFFGFVGYILWKEADDIEARRARGEHIEPPSMWP